VFARARGGAVLTGLDGDGLLGGWRWQRAQGVLHRRVRPEPRDALRIALAAAPAALKRRALSRTLSPALTWLRPEAQATIAEALIEDGGAAQARTWPRQLAWYSRRRYLSVGLHSLDLLAAAHDVRVSHPLIDPRHLAALAGEGGRAGYGTRGEAMLALFGDLLPRELFTRHTKAVFDSALWGPRAREFAAQWDGDGIDPALVDADALRAAWIGPSPSLAAGTLLQDAWLSSQPR
jgi:asparagine synthase (glutamine-hydrolysing)